MSLRYDMTTPCDRTVEASDTESFHSAISNVTEQSSKCWSSPSQKATITSDCLVQHGPVHKRPRSRTVCSRSTSTSKASDPRPSPRPSRHNSISIPSRQSSLARKQPRSRKDSISLHRQSCQLFSSLDGVLALSRDITPLPSTSTSRTTTRHASIIPEDDPDQDSIRRICERIDAKLTAVEYQHHDQPTQYPYTYGYSYALPASGNDRPPNLRSDTLPHMSHINTRRSESVSVPPTATPERPTLNTVISWTSNATRRAEYEKIDRAHSGVRGLLRRVLPRRLRTKGGRRGFFTGECDGDSVRRFRLDVSDDDSDTDHQTEGDETPKIPQGTEFENEKSVPRVKEEVGAEEGDADREIIRARGTKDGVKDRAKSRKWSCFAL
ncbi:uncharacterized protein Z520_11214 [Fonsecaea multimorphosa CBS 102226]|uniref:Uncharacterized protein n=1 Tax=Fonsecaea multimorphosa CBS 102226 TaxID=1442371 RepID=A0A0D2JIY4_9EURO|nr:uncharacterized protein Z520_11214 [Fonsecaea multimorphosa CBS 102226]KIX93157.1 hypothetical protein Z520_11214 [Fonsecaea multimorphosa CBS 102226]OAL18358.1 hypothetical protein AYO22_10774 [Fonsecaea multimorphosa]